MMQKFHVTLSVRASSPEEGHGSLWPYSGEVWVDKAMICRTCVTTCRCYSGFAPEAFTTFAHLAISLRTWLATSPYAMERASMPAALNRSRTS